MRDGNPAGVPDCPGLAIVNDGLPIRLKWHRLRRSMREPLFGAETLAEGLALGASLELDLRVRGDKGFVVLHDACLEGETTGRGVIASLTREQVASARFPDGRPLILSEDLAQMLERASPSALLQFDMKDDLAAIGERGIAHLRELFAATPVPVIVSGDSLELIVEVRRHLPRLLRGIDPTDRLVEIGRAEGLAALERRLLDEIRGPTEPHTVYLAWELLLEAARAGLDLVALCHAEGRLVDAWTYTLADPARGFSGEEWQQFSALAALHPDQITTDEAPATERAWRLRTGVPRSKSRANG